LSECTIALIILISTFRHYLSSGGQHQEPQHRPAAEPDQRPPEDVGGGHLQGRSRRQLLGLDDEDLQLSGPGHQHPDQDLIAETSPQL